ncbi:PepSY domain-containing protein [Mucilaginibacter pallidiroseus]|uniref:PepSY domain-containing protein n=1 Tax=Mucilaginibacter pallidiroseus TaxID=2599295 RepID=A0A563U503_9SPHI|nr:PepSY-associated TM helix domain-containing protein [Mucilaginibacter pallidiroseus]TWR26440.1 PepSY domain-containing protein [Mucilaginibacter pallidiroseus]
MATAKQNFYKWHRILGLIALVPVISWALSGLSHPFMSNWFRPTIAQEVYKPAVQSQLKPALSLKQVLDKNKISQFRNFGLVNFYNHTYYQVMGLDSVINYYSANDATLLNNGDQLYATYLARYFTADSTSKVKSITLQKTFDGQYQPINRLLPVWKVSFDTPNGMDVYIETSQSRMGTFNNTTRKVMLVVFEQLHTWAFLKTWFGERVQLMVLFIAVSAMLFSLISGLVVYGLFWKKFKTVQQARREQGKADKRIVHRYHRQIGLIVSFVMLTFAASALFHVIVKLNNVEPQKISYSQVINSNDLKLSNLSLPINDSVIVKSGLVKFQDSTYYQVSDNKKIVHYINTATGNQLNNGDNAYAAYLAAFYRRNENQKVYGQPKISQVRQFDNEYGFINKRLPVQKISYPDGQNWYIETTTSQLATKVAGIDRAEGFSFIFLHKYFGMSWAGKNVRDIVSMLAALGVLVAALFGFAAFIKNK